jgi:hypothetical protein
MVAFTITSSKDFVWAESFVSSCAKEGSDSKTAAKIEKLVLTDFVLRNLYEVRLNAFFIRKMVYK